MSMLQPEKSTLPEQSCVSMKSDNSMGRKDVFQKDSLPSEHRMFQREKSPLPEQSCVSMKSDNSMGRKEVFQKDSLPSEHRMFQREKSPLPEQSCVSMKSDNSMGRKDVFRKDSFPSEHRPLPQTSASSEHACKFINREQDMKTMEAVCSGIPFSADRSPATEDALEKHKFSLKIKSQFEVNEIAKQKNRTLLHHIYTELFITVGETSEVSRNHEVRLIEKTFFQPAKKDTPINCNDIFETMPDQQHNLRTVMTKGVAGIGKTVSVQKFVLDWAEGAANQHIDIILPIPFRELNLMKERKLSMMNLLHHFFKEITDFKDISDYKVLFIFDGLDECRIPLNFQKRERCCDIMKSTSVGNLLTSLIKGDLLPSALVWITSRPAAASQIPPMFIDRVTEVRGFNDPQKEEYFRKRIGDKKLADRIVTHIKASRSLFIMCHIPVFCWLSAAVLEKTLENEEIPNTLTQMYTHFLIMQTSIKKSKYPEMKEQDEEIILKLGKLAFQQLCNGNLIFYEADLKKCGINIKEASVYSGVFTQIFREEFVLTQRKMFSFVHLSIQEHLAALYVFFSFGKPVSGLTSELKVLLQAPSIHEFHKAAVDMAIKSENGHLDLFLRFVLGLSMESNQNLLQSLLPQTGRTLQRNEGTVQYVMEKIREDPSSDRRINLLYCLIELNHHSIVDKIEKSSGMLSIIMLVPEKWATLTFEFHTSEEELDNFNLTRYIHTPVNDLKEFLSPDEVLLRLLPAVETASSATLKNSSLTVKSCGALASAFSANRLQLIQLNLRENKLKDSGMGVLCAGLASAHCKLEKLELRYCFLRVESCCSLASALSTKSSQIKELNLRDNKHMLDLGIIKLCKGLQSEHCKLETLLLSGCMLSEKCCEALASVLGVPSSTMRELELSCNNIQDVGVELLCVGLQNQHCKLEKLLLCRCKLTVKSCAALATALSSSSSTLKELRISGNKLQNSEVNTLLALKKDPDYKLEKLIW
ncbi:NACHT, LRR and PYD domains-containing protein 12 isoform X3 [Astyanax mexicanus]|uniref:NACHT, LRR and PYD domains-containing protein 12 isoform X3 n=1 Tax=Astyanax mexicanus TaxID=7994 RepID=UPI0020CB1D50|nr:NACHT, LRR and PYD domains-containing protein 12 isoform X3 [Astyanax mexicanus]